ncbi:MAG: prolipoprotein diacylglyceryl transferase [Ginsengibacter sp.]
MQLKYSAMQLLYTYWNIDPEIFRIGAFGLRYYSVLFVLAFIASYYLLTRIFKKENVPQRLLDKLFLYVFIGTLAGARLGHTLFYEFGYYKNHLLEIILPFTFTNGRFEFTGYQGLASHGAALGILLAVVLYCKKYRQSFLWVMDRLVIAVALSGFFIRVGNLFNSEIIGKPTKYSWGIIFERADLIPRYPAQLFEAFSYLLIFVLLWIIYKRKTIHLRKGFLFGLFLILVFTARFLIEFVKEKQEAFEAAWSLNLGQILSLPFILTGVFFLIHGSKAK